MLNRRALAAEHGKENRLPTTATAQRILAVASFFVLTFFIFISPSE